MGGDRDGNPNVTAKVTRDVSLLSRWMAIDLYIRELDNLRFELSMNCCRDTLSNLAQEVLDKELSEERKREHWNQGHNRSQSEQHSLELPSLPMQLPAGAGLPTFTECRVGESPYPRVRHPGTNHLLANIQDGVGSSRPDYSLRDPNPSLQKEFSDENISNSPRAASFNSSSLLAQRKLFAESQVRITSFQKLLEPSRAQQPMIAPYRTVLGHVKDKLAKTRRRLELLLEDLPCEYDPGEHYETSDQLLEPLLLCYESLQSCGSGVLADGRLADLIRRVATFGMNLMKLDLRQESGRHSDTLDAITKHLEIGTYSDWDEEKKLEFLTMELKGKRPLVATDIEVPPDVKEVLDTFHVADELGSDSLGAYVISMASNLAGK